MGLLDDAIREHLELKRRRGADPEEVAREQHEALDPIDHGPATVAAHDELADVPSVPEAPHEPDGDLDLPQAGVMAGRVPEDMHDDLADDSQAGEPPPAVPPMDETAELDMSAVFEEDAGSDDGMPSEAVEEPSGRTPSVAGGVRPAGSPPAQHNADEESGGDSLEWEMPGNEDDAEPVDEREEDVLEEMPEFLRDTPEQERLWFEQRPPRDFDFDK